jgi:hypothetical protein
MPNYSNTFPPKSIAPGESVYLFGAPGNVAINASPGGLVRLNGVVTATTAVHNFVPGQRVSIFGTVSVKFGANNDLATIYGFDGEYLIKTVPSTTTFTFDDIGNPNDTGGGGTANSIQAEQPAVPQAGAQVCIVPRVYSGAVPSIAIEVMFTAAPGVFSLAIQEADSDADAAYITPTVAENPAGVAGYTIAAVDAVNQNARVDLSPTGGRFIRPRLVSRANAVGLVVKATALA